CLPPREPAMRPSCLLVLCCGLAYPSPSCAEPPPAKCREAVRKGLEWLARQQARDGHWHEPGFESVAATSLAGTTLLMEGSPLHHGKYAVHLRCACNWLLSQARPDGLIADLRERGAAGRYLEGHAFAIFFLSSILEDETDVTKRDRIEIVLNRAVQF